MAAPPASRCSLPVLSTDPFPAGLLRQNCPDAHPVLQSDPDCFFSFFWLPFLSYVVCWTEGAAGLPTNTSNADIRGCRAERPLHLHEGSFRQDSRSLQSGIYAPLQRSSPCRYCASVLVLSLFASPISEANRMLRPRLPSSTTSCLTPYCQRTRPSPSGCNRGPSWAGSLSLGR